VIVYDHHHMAAGEFPATQTIVDEVGAATTLIVEQLQAKSLVPTIAEATVMALGFMLIPAR
jgi:tRNA nucleotidyltransferase (CCA-adding enzyme)